MTEDILIQLAKIRSDLIAAADQIFVDGRPQKNRGLCLPETVVRLFEARELVEQAMEAELGVSLKRNKTFDKEKWVKTVVSKSKPDNKNHYYDEKPGEK